jgi:rod shape determining protein RodA
VINQRDRVHTFLNPEADPLGRGYHIIQSKIAIGSGGIYGKGWLAALSQSWTSCLKAPPISFLPFLPKNSVYSAAWGLLILYLLIIVRCLYIATQAQDTYSRLLASSLAFTFFVYVFVNIGMVIGILPVVVFPCFNQLRRDFHCHLTGRFRHSYVYSHS